MDKEKRRTFVRKLFRIISIASLVIGCFILTAPIFADKTERSPEESQRLDSRLRELSALEKSLPASRKPPSGLREAEKAQAADSFFKAGLLCHDIQREFAESMVKKADEYLRASLAYRESSLTRAYLGSAHLIQARDASSAISKIAEVNTGLNEIDAAVNADPNDILVRALRVECTIELPAMFNRLDVVTKDLKLLLEEYAKSPDRFASIFPPSRLFELKAKELELRGKSTLAAQYRQRAKETAKAETQNSASKATPNTTSGR
jgi:hypothetical protein